MVSPMRLSFKILIKIFNKIYIQYRSYLVDFNFFDPFDNNM